MRRSISCPIFILISALACATGLTSCVKTERVPRFSATLGTSQQELITKEGKPDRVQTRAIPGVGKSRQKVTLYLYPDNKTYQLQDGRVTARFRDAKNDEITLQSWRHRWKGVATFFEPSRGHVRKTHDDASGSQRPETGDDATFEFRAPSLGMTVLYSTAIDRITRVIEYAPTVK